jgi:hypothetical protein
MIRLEDSSHTWLHYKVSPNQSDDSAPFTKFKTTPQSVPAWQGDCSQTSATGWIARWMTQARACLLRVLPWQKMQFVWQDYVTARMLLLCPPVHRWGKKTPPKNDISPSNLGVPRLTAINSALNTISYGLVCAKYAQYTFMWCISTTARTYYITNKDYITNKAV